jgi:hypothetical protein
LRHVDSLGQAPDVAKLVIALLLLVVAVELVMVIGVAGGLILLGAAQSIAVGAGMALVALASVVVCWMVTRRG